MRNYFALIDEADDGFGVSFPDLPGCVSMGHTLDEAAESAREALALFLDELISDGVEIPPARSFASLRADAEIRTAMNDGAVAILVSLPFEPEKRERINVMFSKNLLWEVDVAVEESGLTRSAFLERAAFEKLHKPAIGELKDVVDDEIARGLQGLLRNLNQIAAHDGEPATLTKDIQKSGKIARNAETGRFSEERTSKSRFSRKFKHSK